MKFTCCILVAILISQASAVVYQVPERLFKMAGSQVNTTQDDLLYKSQAGGYYTGGGGMTVRTPVKDAKLVRVEIPKMPEAGCGGIDIYHGGFSFISGDEIVETMQAVASNAAGFAFMLGLETVSPAACNTMRQLQSWANTVNGIGINSCEAAAALVGSVWPANDMADQHVCRTAGSLVKYPDYIKGRSHCSIQKETREALDKHTMLKSEYNIAWEALMSQPYFKDGKNQTMAELYMTLVGTFVVRKNEENPEYHFSKIGDGTFLKSLLEGGSIEKYKCGDKEKCLVVKEIPEFISEKDSWFGRTRKILSSMQYKAVNDQPLDSDEKGLLSTSRLPLYKFVNVLSAYHRGKPFSTDMDSLADIVTWDIFVQLANEAIETVRRGCIQIKASSMYSSELDRYLSDLDHVKQELRRYEEYVQKSFDIEMRLIQKMQLLEQQINSEIMAG
jgi:conjugative transfer pilus assembly protein TraH